MVAQHPVPEGPLLLLVQGKHAPVVGAVVAAEEEFDHVHDCARVRYQHRLVAGLQQKKKGTSHLVCKKNNNITCSMQEKRENHI